MLQEMKDDKIHLIPIIDAGVKIEDGYDVYEEGVEKGIFLQESGWELFRGGRVARHDPFPRCAQP